MAEHWTLFVDESGDFDEAEDTVVVAGVLARGRGDSIGRVLRETISDCAGFLGWPLHTAHFNREVLLAYAWLRGGWTALDPRAMEPPVRAAFALAPGLEAALRGDPSPSVLRGALRSLESAGSQGRDDWARWSLHQGVEGLLGGQLEAPEPGRLLANLAWASRAAVDWLDRECPRDSAAVRDAVARGRDPSWSALGAVSAALKRGRPELIAPLRAYQQEILGQIRRTLRRGGGGLRLAMASESWLGDAVGSCVHAPRGGGDRYLALLMVLTERVLDDLEPRGGTLDLVVLERDVCSPITGDTRPLNAGHLEHLIAALGRSERVRRASTARFRGEDLHAMLVVADLLNNRLRRQLRVPWRRLGQLDSFTRSQLGLRLVGGRGRPLAAAHGRARDHVEVARSRSLQAREFAGDGLRPWAREQAVEWAEVFDPGAHRER